MYELNKWKSPEDAAKYKKIVEKKRMYKFLLRLNKNLDEVRGRILATKPLPNIREASSEVRREESKKKLMLGSFTHQFDIERLALVARGSYPQPSDNRQKKGRLWCEHCKNLATIKKHARTFMVTG